MFRRDISGLKLPIEMLNENLKPQYFSLNFRHQLESARPLVSGAHILIMSAELSAAHFLVSALIQSNFNLLDYFSNFR